jgi:hypothetical protein
MRSNQLNYVPDEEGVIAPDSVPRHDLVGGIRLERMTFCL